MPATTTPPPALSIDGAASLLGEVIAALDPRDRQED
jgi:hypothetical protein